MNRGGKKKLAGIIAGIMFFYSIVGFFIIPLVAEKMLPPRLSEMLQRPVAIQGVRFNPFTLTATMDGFQVSAKDGTQQFITFKRLRVNLQLRSLLHMGPVLKEVTLDSPVLNIARFKGNTFNFSDLLNRPAEKKNQTAEKPPAEPVLFAISNIRIRNGCILLDDQAAGKKHTLTELNFALPFVSNFEKYHETQTKPGLSVQINQTLLKTDVQSKPFSRDRETRVDLQLSGMNLPRYFDYLPMDLGFSIPHGSLDVTATISFLQPEDQPVSLQVSGKIGISDFAMIDSKQAPIVTVEKLDAVLDSANVLKKDIRIRSITMVKPEVYINRDASGSINLQQLGPRKPSAAEAPQAVDDGAQLETAAESDDFRLQIQDFRLQSAGITFQDSFISPKTPKPLAGPASIHTAPLDLQINGLTTMRDQKATFRMTTRINPKGHIELSGRFGLNPLEATTRFKIKDLVFPWLEPYLQDQAKLAITDGRVSTNGKIELTTDPKGEVRATLNCDAALEDLKTVDRIKAENFFQLKGLFLDGVTAGVNPSGIQIEEIRLSGVRSQIATNADGVLNLRQVLVEQQQDKPETPAPEKVDKPAVQPEPVSKFPIKIPKVTLGDIQVDYQDHQIQPSFATTLTLRQGSISGLTSENFQNADVDIKGLIGDAATLSISGKINPLQENLFADMDVRLSGLELSPLTPYAGKFIGRAIAKGKLSFDINSRIENNQLAAKDNILIDQLSMGKSTESPDALNLPVDLAIAVLQDRSGKINLDIPVSGRLDDPDFSLKGIILQTLVNIMEKAATAPFTMIAGIAGSGEDLQFIGFNPGRADLDATAHKKLDTITTVLYERPKLKLEISGYVDLKADRSRLQEMKLTRKILSLKQLGRIEEGQPLKTLENIEIKPAEYQTYLKQIYHLEIGSPPPETLSPEKMAQQIQRAIPISDSDLRQLSLSRAKTVKAYILKKKQIDPNRLFLVESQSLSPASTEKFAGERVELSLQ